MVGECLGTRLHRLLSVDLPRSHDARHDESREPRERPAAAKPSHPAEASVIRAALYIWTMGCGGCTQPLRKYSVEGDL
jgi:hypothetical protein